MSSRFSIAEDTATVGLVLSSFVQITTFLGLVCYAVGILASNINVVQRIKRWTDNKDFEDQSRDKSLKEWPTHGKIEMQDLTIRYREGLPNVIKRLNLSVEAGQKVGILGRTGSGKSTLLLALLRILEIHDEPEKPNGSIKIDEVDLRSLSLQTIRRKVVTIPQDPYLLAGSLRFNIDPEGIYTDRQIYESLQKVDFFGSATNNPETDLKNTKNQQEPPMVTSNNKLELSHVDDNNDELKYNLINEIEIEAHGANLSLGQRQLICIARALIQKPKILLTDEATASIDLKTDQLIQELIKTELKDTTVLTIAHRLNTIIEYDKVVVLKDGEKVEEGSPHELLSSPGEFYDLVREGGVDFLQEMRIKAKEAAADKPHV